ncbi:hypothetical protein D6D13_01982 [Aureobasidium pullulans]|uniref:Uncharacterized protein n=2 Tax=Aureobasidium pullulans TaxID=5580 RepID=A0A4S9D5N4_AURPU|nr:hypothetical protein D6D13_01982 [Aureobasidium pullulans]
MAPTKAQKTVKSTETDDDGGITFKKKQDDLRKSVVIRQEKARTRIRKNRSNKQKDLQKRIESLKRNITVEQPGTDADASSQTAFGTLRDLLARKTDIEKRITESIEGLERAMHTTSREFQVVLASRAELLTTTAAAAAAAAATTASAGPTAVIVKP